MEDFIGRVIFLAVGIFITLLTGAALRKAGRWPFNKV